MPRLHLRQSVCFRAEAAAVSADAAEVVEAEVLPQPENKVSTAVSAAVSFNNVCFMEIVPSFLKSKHSLGG